MILTPRCEPSGEPAGWLGKRNRATGEADLAVEAKEVAVGQPAAAESAAASLLRMEPGNRETVGKSGSPAEAQAPTGDDIGRDGG